MANIRFKNVILHNFMSYEHEEFNLDRNGYIFISGVNNNDVDNATSNGSGKSTLFSALCWCLTGETPSGNKQIENIYLSGETYVELYFEIDNDSYVIKRTKNPSNLFITINGEDKSGKGIRDSEKLLVEYLPDVTSSLINSVIILGQGLPKRFTNNTPSGRKEVLEKLSNSDFMIADIKNRLSDRQSKLKEDENNYQTALAEKITKINMFSEMITKNTEQLNNINIAELERTLDKLRSDIIVVERDISSFEAAKEETEVGLNAKQIELGNISDAYNEDYSKLDLISQEEIDNLVSKVATLKTILQNNETEVLKLESITDICPTCGQKLPNVEKFDTTELRKKCEDLREDISNTTANLENSKKFNDALITQLDAKYSERKSSLHSSIDILNSDVRNYTNIITEKSNKQKEISNNIVKTETEINAKEQLKVSLADSIKSYKANIEALTEESEETSKNLDDIQARLEVLSKMNSLIKRDFRGYLLTDIIKFISDKTKLYSQKVFGSDNFNFELDGNNISISYDGKEYESLSGGEKQKADVIIQLAIRDMMCSYLNFSSNILVLDEITDSLDVTGSQNILNLISSELSDVEAIYIISHHSDFSIPWDEEVTIIKDNDRISRVV